MPDRTVRTTLVIDDKGSVKVVKGVGDEAARTESKLGHLDKGVKGLGKSFGGLKSMLMGGLGLVGAGGIAFGLKDVISKTKEVAEETEKFHTVTGISSQSSLKYSQALKARGLSGETVNKAFGFLAKNLRTAELQETKLGQAHEKSTLAHQKQQLTLAKAIQGGKALAIAQAQIGVASAKSTTEVGRQAKAIKELTGLSAQQFKALGSEETKLKTVTKAFEGLAAGEKKTRLEKELFGRGGQALSTVLEKGNLSLEHYVGLVEKYYGKLSGGAKGEQELLARQSEAKLAWEGLEYQLGTKLTPVIIKVFAWFTKVIGQIDSGHGSWGRLAKDVEGVAKWLKGLWEGFSKAVGPANALKVAVGGLLTAMVVSKVATFAGALKGLNAISFAGLAGNLKAALGPLIAAALAAESIKKSVAVHHPSKAPSRGIVSDVGGFFTGGLLGNPATSPINIARGAAEDLAPGHPHHTALSGISGASDAGIKVDLHIDGHKFAEAIGKNPRAARRIAEDTAHYGLKRAARE